MKKRTQYEKPDGWAKGLPEVLVADTTIDRLGMPVVDYDSVHKLLTDNIGIPYKSRSIARLYGKRGDESPKRSRAIGRYLPLTKSMRVNAVVAELHPDFQITGGTIRILAHEARHKSDHMRHKGFNVPNLLTAAQISVGAGEYFGVVRQLPQQYQAIGVAGMFATLAALKRVTYPITEAPALAEEVKQSTIDHETDILFPESPRSWYLRDMGRLSVRNMEDMGWPVTDTLSAYDFTPPIESFSPAPTEAK